ncbi:MAG: L-fuculose kinase [Gemmatales bacterium]|nr:MAG: L-fuculose kinase [Gemmatales bacterium]
MQKRILAFDLGAESGRAILGRFDGNTISLDIVHRFANGPVRTLDTLHWDVLRLYQEMIHGMRRCASEFGGADSIGIDTWGVDFALLGRHDHLLGNPRHYRDPHTETILETALERVDKWEIFRQTGIQFMRINTLFQLLAMQRDRSPILEVAQSLLLIPDLFNFWFTGVKVNEFSDATTTQMLDPRSRNWAFDLLNRFGLPVEIFGSIVQPGTVIGPLRAHLASETGLSPVPVIAPATHDTGSAVAAVPANARTWAYISSGTWSLMGVEIPQPIINEKTLAFNFTNEGGVGGTIRLLKNIMGLWLVQECRRIWEKQGQSYEYAQLARLAEEAPPFASIVNPDDESFLLPADMPAALAEFCRRTNQPVPQSPGEFVRCALESLALRYRWVLQRLEELTEHKIEAIHIVGGGSQNDLLCQLTADACNRPVFAGPVEATAIGNLLVQAMGLGLLQSLADAREVVRRSFALKTYEPRDSNRWDEHYERFCRLL